MNKENPYLETKKDKTINENLPYYSAQADNLSGKYAIPMHWHNHIEILYFICGRAKVYCGGRWHEVCEGDLLIINSQQVHAVEVCEDYEFKHYVISFDPEFIETYANASIELKYLLPFILSELNYDRIIHGEVIKQSNVPFLIEQIYLEYSEKQFGYELSIKADICKLILWIIRYWQKIKTIPDINDVVFCKKEYYKKLESILKYIKDNYDKNIKVSDMAKECYMSESYFMKFFKTVTGKTFIKYINDLRLSEAEKLLILSDLSISEIAFETGFNSTSYFIKLFRKQKGITPYNYRQKFSGK